MFVCVGVCMCVCVCVCVLCVCVCVYIYILTYMCICIYRKEGHAALLTDLTNSQDLGPGLQPA